MENYKHPTKRLGKHPFIDHEKDIHLTHVMVDQPKNPPHFNPYKGWKTVPAHAWGNDAWGDCVFATRANAFIRLEKIEHRRILPLLDQMVVDEYKRRTGAQTPGDAHDQGFVPRDANELWRAGWELHLTTKKPKTYSIDAYARVNYHNEEHVKTAIHALNNLQLGFAMPLNAQHMRDWDVSSGPGREPGSWGGHLVDAFGYDDLGVLLWTWGQRIHCSWSFIDLYCDEAWSVIDSKETVSRWIDNAKLEEILAGLGS